LLIPAFLPGGMNIVAVRERMRMHKRFHAGGVVLSSAVLALLLTSLAGCAASAPAARTAAPAASGTPTPHSIHGTIAEFPIPTANSTPFSIAAGPDGALWFTEHDANRIGRITTAGIVSEYAIPTANSDPVRITAGPDGALWFTEADAYKIGRITTSGIVSEYALTTANSGPIGITAGPDGGLWFIQPGSNQIGRLS
jgi:virginiamycin B lyase